MNCKYFCIRSRKGNKYKYCRLLKKEIEYEDCRCCDSKEYKQYKGIQGHKHTQTKKTAIQKGVKKIVWQRDKGECIFCHKKVPVYYANAHLIPRSAGGLGIEENMFTACQKCHQEQDNGISSVEYTTFATLYLMNLYDGWSEEKLKYKKY